MMYYDSIVCICLFVYVLCNEFKQMPRVHLLNYCGIAWLICIDITQFGPHHPFPHQSLFSPNLPPSPKGWGGGLFSRPFYPPSHWLLQGGGGGHLYGFWTNLWISVFSNCASVSLLLSNINLLPSAKKWKWLLIFWLNFCSAFLSMRVLALVTASVLIQN